MKLPKYYIKFDAVPGIPRGIFEEGRDAANKFGFRTNEYYLSLIDWNDPNDPIRKIIIPQKDELEEWGFIDPSQESTFTKQPGLQHKYPPTALMLVNNFCGSFCRFCFRKRIFMKDNKEIDWNFDHHYKYILGHKEIDNVLLTGGEPLLLPTKKLNEILENLSKIPHVESIRIGTKLVAFNPIKLLADDDFFSVVNKFSKSSKRLYFILHFNHPKELTPYSLEVIEKLRNLGAILCCQTPVLKGINDRPEALNDLFRKLTNLGIVPYYVFQCRPTIGNKPFALPLEESYRIFTESRKGLSGLAKRARFIISSRFGKVMVSGIDDGKIVFQYHMAVDLDRNGKTIICKRNPKAYWLDDYPDFLNEAEGTMLGQ